MPAGRAPTLRKAPLTRRQKGAREALGLPLGWAAMGSRLDCRGEETGSVATCFPARRGGAFPLPLLRTLPALPSTPQASGCFPKSRVSFVS